MKLVKVLIPFNDKVTGKTYKTNDEIELSDDRIAEIKAFNINMLLVIGEAEKPKKKASKKDAE